MACVANLTLADFTRQLDACLEDVIVIEAKFAAVTSKDARLATILAQVNLADGVNASTFILSELVAGDASITLARSLNRAIGAVLDQALSIDAQILIDIEPVVSDALITSSWMRIASRALVNFARSIETKAVLFIEVVAFSASVAGPNARH